MEHTCGVCGFPGPFPAKGRESSLRETACPRCGAPRRTSDLARAVLLELGQSPEQSLQANLDVLAGLRILELQAQGAIHDCLAGAAGYQCCDVFVHARPGTTGPSGVLSQDPECLTYQNASFDLVISQDIMEHVTDPWTAFEEISRVLAPGGKHIFTVPIHEGRKSRSRLRPSGGAAGSLEPVFHIDIPDQDERLVHWDFGDDLRERLSVKGIHIREVFRENFYLPEEITDLEDPGQLHKYRFLRTRKALERVFRYNSVVFAAGPVVSQPAPLRVHFSAQTDDLQVSDPERVSSPAFQSAQLGFVRSETVVWGGRPMQMLDLALHHEGWTALVFMVKVFWGEVSTFVFPSVFSQAEETLRQAASQACSLLERLAASNGGRLPETFHLDGNGSPLNPVPPEQRALLENGPYTRLVPALRRLSLIRSSAGSGSVLVLGSGRDFEVSRRLSGLQPDKENRETAFHLFLGPDWTVAELKKKIAQGGLQAPFSHIVWISPSGPITAQIGFMEALCDLLEEGGRFFYCANRDNDNDRTGMSLPESSALLDGYFRNLEYFHQNVATGHPDQAGRVVQGLPSSNESWMIRCSHARERDVARPRVSVLLPTLSRWKDTQWSLTRLAESVPTDRDWELVIIDGGAGGVSGHFLDEYPWPVINHNNQGPVSLAEACNQAAILARGEILLLLEEEAGFQPGCFAPLIDELAESPETGMASGILLQPDGKVFDAGKAIGRDQMPRSLYQGLPPDDPLVGGRREFPVLSSICAAFRRSDFLEVGGFRSGFGEHLKDADLCLRFRNKGKKCVFRPESGAILSQDTRLLRMPALPDKTALLSAWRYDLVQDDFAYLIPEKVIRNGSRNIRFALKIEAGQRGDSIAESTILAECLAMALVQAGHTCLIHYQSEWGGEDADVDVVIHLKDTSLYYPKPWNLNLVWPLETDSGRDAEDLQRYDAVLDFETAPFLEQSRRMPEVVGAQARSFPAITQTLLATFAPLVASVVNLADAETRSQKAQARISEGRTRLGDTAYRRSGPLVSVLIATHDRRDFLEGSLRSIMAQTYENWEVCLVCDGGPPVDDIVESLNEPRIRLVRSERNHGKGHAVNTAFAMSRGEFIAYNDDDDIWLTDHLERLMLAVREIPGIRFTYSDAMLVTLAADEAGGFTETGRELKYQRQVALLDIMEFNWINGISVLHHRNLYRAAGGFDEKLKALIDFDMWKRLSALAYPYHVSRVTAEHYIRTAGKGSQITSLAEKNPLLYRKQRIRIMRKRLPLPDASPYHTLQGSLLRKTLFEYFIALCRKLQKEGKEELAGRLLEVALKYKVPSIEALRGLALYHVERKAYGQALDIYEEIDPVEYLAPGDLFMALLSAIRSCSLPLALKYDGLLSGMTAQLSEEARKIHARYKHEMETLASRVKVN